MPIINSAPAVSPQLDALTSMRFFAAMLVLLFHYAWFFPGEMYETTWIRLGSSGVTFFFILSGFILAYTYEKTDFKNIHNVRKFYVARVSRIYPVYLLSLLLGLPAYLAYLKAASPAGQLVAATTPVLAPLVLHAWVPGAACALNCPSWSISAEAFFYACFPFMLPLVLKRPRTWLVVVLVSWVIIAFAYLRLWEALRPGQQLFNTNQDGNFVEEFVKFFPAGRMPEFILGIALFAIWRRSRLSAKFYLIFAVLSFFLLILAQPLIPTLLINNGIMAIGYAPLILAGASMTGGFLAHPWLIHFGRISFALYLLHVPVAAFVERVDRRLFDAVISQDHPVARVVISAVLALVASAIVFHFVEEPGRRVLRERFALKPTRTATETSAA